MVKIRQIQDNDLVQITKIYNWYILNTTITFEVESVCVSEIEHRVRDKVGQYNWLVAEDHQDIVGYAYYGAFHPRPAYHHTIESTIYLAHHQTGKGLGTALYQALIQSARDQGFREIVGLIALPNDGSTRLHEKLGFQNVGVLQNVGYKFGRYIDVSIWQRSL